MLRGRTRIFLFSAFAPLLATPAAAEQPAPFAWHGFYVGYHSGGALALADVDNPFGPSIFGDTIRTPGPLGGGQLGYNWQLGSGAARPGGRREPCRHGGHQYLLRL